MSWGVVNRKVLGIRAGLNDWELQSLEREFVETTNRISTSQLQSPTARGVLFIDMAYAVSQHRDWLQTHVFSALLVEFLQYDHGLIRGDAEILVHDVVEAAMTLGLSRPRNLFSGDRDFLTWAYVCAAGASDEASLESDLGLGRAVLRKLKEGLRALEAVDNNSFVSEYDSMLAAIVLDLSQQSRSNPWAIDCERIKFALLSAGGDVAEAYILPDTLPIIVDALVSIGYGMQFALSDRPSLAELLVAAGLIMEVKTSSRRKKPGYVLTDLGARVSALKVALTLPEELPIDEFLKLNNQWQIVVIKRTKSLTFDYMARLLSDYVNKLAPEVSEAIAIRMIELNPDGFDGPIVRRILNSCTMTWHKASIIRALKNGKPSVELVNAIAGELTNSASPGVRLAAGALLDSWTGN
jgi:hypothetical protein